MNTSAIMAVWKRQAGSLLANPLGYVFILVFVVASAVLVFWPDEYYSRNIADFGELITYMPWLLVVLLPAFAMGSWSNEREIGTEEQMLTMPMSLADALLGKWLGIASFFTLCMAVCCLDLYMVLVILGDPDLGVVIANILGWWFIGLFFASVSILASTLVGMPAIAFVLGGLFCAVINALMLYSGWLDEFNRGVVPPAMILLTLLLTAAPLFVAGFGLSARRWQPGMGGYMAQWFLAILLFAYSAFNILHFVDRQGADIDLSAEGVASLSDTSRTILTDIDGGVQIAAFISAELPKELEPKGQELLNKLRAIERHMGSSCDLDIYRPMDPTDDAGAQATGTHGIEPHKAMVFDVAGREIKEVFLGAAIRRGANVQTIPYFEPGLSVEYELVRAIRYVNESDEDRKIIGIVDTGIGVSQWQVASEWEKQYETRSVTLDVEVNKRDPSYGLDDEQNDGAVDVLVAMQPNLLSEEQLQRLHDAIWEGVPTLLMIDPAFINNPGMSASRGKTPPQQNPYMQTPPMPPANLGPILSALDLRMDMKQIAWSSYRPSHEFAHMQEQFIWAMKDQGAVKDHGVMDGVNSMIYLFPGFMRKSGSAANISVEPLATPTPDLNWGFTSFDDHFMDPYGGGQLMPNPNPPPLKTDRGSLPMLAAYVSGRMKRAYPFMSSEEEPDELAGEEKTEGEDKEEEDDGLGRLSESEVAVLVVADVDLASDSFFHMYRDEQGQVASQDNYRILSDLRNVQFMGNAIDQLLGDKELISLRTRRPATRRLTTLEAFEQTENEVMRQEIEAAQKELEKTQARLEREKRDKLAELEKNWKGAQQALLIKKALMEVELSRKMGLEVEKKQGELEKAKRNSAISRNREIRHSRSKVRMLAVGIPAAVLAFVAMIVFARRLSSERLAVPEDRQRSKA